MSWSFAYALNPGADHEQCDDVAVCETLGDVVVAAVADGAGSAKRGREGACITCQVFLEQAVGIYSGTVEPSCLISVIKERIPEEERYDFSCTLVGAVAGPKGAIFLQVGDGAAVVSFADNIYETALIPERSEFINQTFFVTGADAEEHLLVKRIDQPVRELALFSDGLQHLVIDLKDDQPHQPFFAKTFETLSEEVGFDTRTSWWLQRTLSSDSVTKRTDDDTSIVIARRIG